MDVPSFCRPRASAQTALALLTASAHDDDESIYDILKESDTDQLPAVLVALCALVVGGWPEDGEMDLPRWLAELGKRVADMTEHLPPLA